MLVKASDVIGLKVLALHNGHKIEIVEDVLYDPKEHVVKALQIHSGGLFPKGKIVPLNDIKSIGKDAVIIESDSVLRDLAYLPKTITHISKHDSQVSKSTLITEEGNEIGLVSDMYFDPYTGVVEALDIRNSKQKTGAPITRVYVTDIKVIGPEYTIISAAHMEKDGQQLHEKHEAFIAQQPKLEDFFAASSQGMQAKGGMAAAVYQPEQSHVLAHRFQPESKGRNKLIELRDRLKATISDADKTLHNAEVYAKSDTSMLRNSDRSQHNESHLRPNYDDASDAAPSSAPRASSTTTPNMVHNDIDVVGKYLTTSVKSLDGTIIAEKGDLVTIDLLRKAKMYGVDDRIYGNTSERFTDAYN